MYFQVFFKKLIENSVKIVPQAMLIISAAFVAWPVKPFNGVF